jgi:hypothetical protein
VKNTFKHKWKLCAVIVVVVFLGSSLISFGECGYRTYSRLLRLAKIEQISWLQPVADCVGRSIRGNDGAVRSALRDMAGEQSFELPWLLTLLASSSHETLLDELKHVYGSSQSSVRGRINSAYTLALITGEKEWLGKMLKVAKEADTLNCRLATLKISMMISDAEIEKLDKNNADELDLQQAWIAWISDEEARQRLAATRYRLVPSW